MSNLVNQSYLLGTKPVIYNVENFTKPAPGQPALISFDDVTTMFHEFGHALHGMFAAQTYPTLSGTNVARDFVEFPSQFNENWALDPKVLPHYAVNYRTGAGRSRRSWSTRSRARAPSTRAMTMARCSKPRGSTSTGTRCRPTRRAQDVDKFEAQALASSGYDVADVPPRYRSSYFLHIWSNGYSAGYYAYPWTRMLGQDAFNWFETHGGLTRANGQRFRDMVLSRGNTLDLCRDVPRLGRPRSRHPALSRILRADRRRLPRQLRRRRCTAPPAPAPAPKKGERGDDAMIRQLDDRTLVSGQIAPHEVAGLAEQGVTMLVNNRPDGEEPDQPLASDIEAAAGAGGHRLSLRADHARHRPGRRRIDAGGDARRAATARCSPSAARARARRSPARWPTARTAHRARRSSSG